MNNKPSSIENIVIPSGIKYLSEHKELNELPSNCIFNKGKVGCGGTTLALESKYNYIIAVPFISLIDSKINKYPNALGVDGYTTNKIIEDYNNREGIKKFIVTYNSLERLIGLVGTEGFKGRAPIYQTTCFWKPSDSLARNSSGVKRPSPLCGLIVW